MQSVPANWGSIFSASHKTEYRFTINGVNYEGDDLKDTPVVSKPLLDKPAIGRCCTGSAKVKIYPKGTIPKAATVDVYCRLRKNADNTVTNWKMKGANRPENYQLRVYDGNQLFAGHIFDAYWYNSYEGFMKDSKTGADINVYGFGEARNSFVAEVFNDDKDSENWWVEFWQNGEKVGDFTRRADSGIHNVPACSYFFNELNKTTTSWAHSNCSHYWYYTPDSGDPSSETDWEVRVYHRIPNNPLQVNVYTCNELTTDYSSF